jgi:hypothetical protein
MAVSSRGETEGKGESGEWGGWRTTVTFFLVKNSLTKKEK